MRKTRFSITILSAAVLLLAAMADGCGIDGALSPTQIIPAAVSAAPSAAAQTPIPTATPTPIPTATPTPAPMVTLKATPTLTPTPSPTPTAIPTVAPLEVSLETIQTSDEYADVDVVYPVISGMADTAFQATFNAMVKSEIEKRVDEIEVGGKGSYEDAAAQGYTFLKYSLDSDVKVHLNNGELLSLVVNVGWYGGGVHGYEERLYYTLVNTDPAKPYSFTELFTKPATAESRILKTIKAAIAKSPDNYFPDPKVTLSDDTLFYLTETELHIVFREESLTSHAGGIPDFAISLKKLQDILAQDILYHVH